jgi:hypothetical protein
LRFIRRLGLRLWKGFQISRFHPRLLPGRCACQGIERCLPHPSAPTVRGFWLLR